MESPPAPKKVARLEPYLVNPTKGDQLFEKASKILEQASDAKAKVNHGGLIIIITIVILGHTGYKACYQLNNVSLQSDGMKHTLYLDIKNAAECSVLSLSHKLEHIREVSNNQIETTMRALEDEYKEGRVSL